MKYIQNEYEMNINDNISLISSKYKFDMNLEKNESLLDFDIFCYIRSFFDFKCCSSSSKDKGDYEVINNSKNENIIDQNNIINDSDDKENNMTNAKIKYFEKFKDFDSYNDYVINMDNSGYLLSNNNNKE